MELIKLSMIHYFLFCFILNLILRFQSKPEQDLELEEIMILCQNSSLIWSLM